MEDAVQALMMGFAGLVFVIGFSLAMYMFSQVTTTAETLVLYADSTHYYDNIKSISEKNSGSRLVNADTVIPTLYRYYKERFAIKIYDANDNLIQIFDLDLESKVEASINHTGDASDPKLKDSFTYRNTYNNSTKSYYMFGVPWLGNNDNIKKRIDLFVRGESGYIGNQYVDYSKPPYNSFHQILADTNIKADNQLFKETFINYAISGDTWTSEDGDTTLVNGNSPKDKIVIIYKYMPKNENLD